MKGNVNEDSKRGNFLPINDLQKESFLQLSHFFMCVDKADLSVHAGLGSVVAQNIVIDIVKCTNATEDSDSPVCKSDEEIQQYFTSKQLYILKNQIRFD